MKSKNVTRFDSKGRLLIPSHIRRMMKAKEGTSVLIIPDEKDKHIKLMPLVKERTAELRLLLEDAPGSLASIANILSQNNLDIIMSESRTLAKGRLAEWDVIIDTSGCDDLENIKKKFLELDNVKDVEILRSK